MSAHLNHQINCILATGLELSENIIQRFIDILKSEAWWYTDSELWREYVPLPIPTFFACVPRDFQLLRQTDANGRAHYTCFVYERDEERATVYDSTAHGELQGFQEEMLKQRYGDIAIQQCRTSPLQPLNSYASSVFAIAYGTHLMCKGTLENFDTLRFGVKGMNETLTEITLRQHLAKIFRMRKVLSFPCYLFQNDLALAIAEAMDLAMDD